ncbi:hypothetical protein [Paraburkholderia sp. MM5482-R1]|uniref:hypothetical protein n=1 Tax=unclassified Paraburkholderia TaxID=2615204 RepID=UPI003D1A3C15
MTVQDDERERELSALFGLDWDPAHERHGVDGVLTDIAVNGAIYNFEVEVKSSTDFDIGTARDFGMAHIERWRKMLFVFGFYSKERGRPELQRCLCLTPVDMEPWLSGKEAQMLIDFKLAARVPRSLDLEDLFAVCGEQDAYSVEDAKKLHKKQYSAAQYLDVPDIVQDGKPRISQTKMLGILKERALYISERGATLNNPHITATFLRQFLGTNREIIGRTHCAPRIRELAANFVRDYPGHPAAAVVA